MHAKSENLCPNMVLSTLKPMYVYRALSVWMRNPKSTEGLNNIYTRHWALKGLWTTTCNACCTMSWGLGWCNLISSSLLGNWRTHRPVGCNRHPWSSNYHTIFYPQNSLFLRKIGMVDLLKVISMELVRGIVTWHSVIVWPLWQL